MGAKFRSYEVRTSSVERVVEATRPFAPARGEVGLLFVTEEFGERTALLAERLAQLRPEEQWILVVTAGVSTERGDVEGEPAVVGLALPGIRAEVLGAATASAEFGRLLARRLGDGSTAGCLTVVRADRVEDDWLEALDDDLGPERQDSLFGAGTPPSRDHYWVQGGRVATAGALAVFWPQPWMPRLTTSAACRLLGPLSIVTKTRGRTLLELDGMSALGLLGRVAEGLDEGPLILLAVAAGENPLSAEGRHVALRAITGVDPDRGGVVVEGELPRGTRVAFAIKDAHAARMDLEAHLTALQRSCRGSAPTFGLYVCCASRGRRLYDQSDVDVRLIGRRFPGLPLLGLHSVFELSPLERRLTPQLYSGVFGVFCAPS